MWLETYNGPAVVQDTLGSYENWPDESSQNGLVLDAAGNIYVAGYGRGLGTYIDWVTIKYAQAPATAENPKRNDPFNFDITPRLIAKNSSIRYIVPVSDYTKIKLYDATRQLVTKIADGYLNAGRYTHHLSNITRGIYFVTCETRAGWVRLKLIVR
ncbi:MAG: T9SS type A sorting domain-containing protein [candidate division WOR-3 bacterium]